MAVPPDADPSKDWVPTDVYDWKVRETNALVLNYTMACPLRCDFCCYSCHSGRTAQTMPFEKALDLVRQAAAIGRFSCIGFTGGEPLLYVDEIVQIAALAKSLGMSSTVATAAHWADSPEEANRVVGALVENGLSRLNISHDPSHAQWVPSENVVNAAIAASDIGVDTYVVGTFVDPVQKLEQMLPQVIGLPYVHLFNKYVAKVGRAANQDITQATYDLDLGLEDLACYRRVHHDVVVFWDGRVYPCCSTFNRSTPGLIAGNAFEETLLSIWERVEGSLLLRTMKRQGFAEVYRIVGKIDAELAERLPLARDAVGPCSLCHNVFKDKTMNADIRRAFDIYESAKVASALNVLEAQIDPQAFRQTLIESTNAPERPSRSTAVSLPVPTMRISK